MIKYILIPEEKIEQFMLEAQSHTGLPASHNIIQLFVEFLSKVKVAEPITDRVLDSLLKHCIKMCDENYRTNKTWKSYDW